MTDITMNEYQDLTMATAIYPGQGTTLGIYYTALGLVGEAGEVAGKVSKLMRDRDDPFAPITEDEADAINKEVGDVLWFCARLLDEIKRNMGESSVENINKLMKRKEDNVLKGSGDDR